MAWHRKSLGELLASLHAEFGEYHYGRIDLDVRRGQKEKAIAHFANQKTKRVGNWHVTRREDLDGIKVYLGETGWVMVRASGTENLLRIYSETSRTETTQQVLEVTVGVIQSL